MVLQNGLFVEKQDGNRPYMYYIFYAKNTSSAAPGG